LVRWQPTNNQIQNFADIPGLPPLKEDLARSFGEDAAGDVWVGCSTGVARYRDGRFRFFTGNDGLPSGGVQYIYSDHKGRLWLGSLRSGLVRIDDPSSDRPTFINYTMAQALSSNA